MGDRFPYTLYTCPCTKDSTAAVTLDELAASNLEGEVDDGENEAEEQPFNPKSARAKFSLYPLEHLLFCNECHEIRCPRCYYEEATWYYCPTCLFDIQCPICGASLAVQSFQASADDRLQPPDATSAREGPCILACQYCSWTSLDVGIKFDRPVNLSGQVAKLRAASPPSGVHGERVSSEATVTSELVGDPILATRGWQGDQYAQLVAFYKAQIAESAPMGSWSISNTFGLDSPSQLTRLLSTYGVGGLKKQRGKVPVMREAFNEGEGSRLGDLDNEMDVIHKMQEVGWDGLTSTAQQRWQDRATRFLSDVWPVATSLRSKRAKRCRICRHILSKFDQKRQRHKYDLRIVALNFLPTITLRSMDPTLDLSSLRPADTIQLLLTFRNPMFDAVNVTLATPPTTPGPVASRVTILCPQFVVGANTDAWVEALDPDVDAERKKARDALEGGQAVAGKIWERGRNWTTVIVEVVPGQIDDPRVARAPTAATVANEAMDQTALEIPLLVRMEYDTEDGAAPATVTTTSDEGSTRVGKLPKIKRELVFWCVAVVGRIEAPAISRAG